MDDPPDSRSTGEDPKKRSTKEIVERKRGDGAAVKICAAGRNPRDAVPEKIDG
ncbi:hypothetical protein [Streptomyces syringium]|uniref:hypothetical protein n=1 Tax=Streptomyces syringium TaxID=76729 RepID=UPI003AAC86B3